MSYSRRFSREIQIPYRGNVTAHYPASKSGGTINVSYSGTATEDVNVEIYVDTDDFDSSVKSCNNTVNGLTASVGAMNAAQCLAIKNNADKVSQTIIDGFFHTIRTDLGTHKTELEQAVQAKLLLLRQQADTLRAKQAAMASDYARTTERYQGLFSDLNKELASRIHQVDQPVFKVVQDVDEQSDRMLHTYMVQTAVTMGKENSLLQAQISMANVKKHALEAMSQARNFLESKAHSENAIRESCIEGNGTDRYFVPVCYMKTESDNNLVNAECAIPEYYATQNPDVRKVLCDKLDNTDFGDDDNTDSGQLKSYVQSEINNRIRNNDEHSLRVKSWINKLLNK